MADEHNIVLVYTTWPSMEAAATAATAFVEAELAACANILPQMTSVYAWKGEIHRETEVVMLLKTRTGCQAALEAAILAAHPYDTPAVLVLPVAGGSAAFLNWIAAQTAHGTAAGERP